MKDLFFASDLAALFQHDAHYGSPKNLAAALRKFGVPFVDRTENFAQMYHALVVHIMDQRGESEPFLAETFIYPEGIIALLKEHSLPIPAALRSQDTAKDELTDLSDPARFEQLFDTVCRNCGTVTDPLASSYRTPVGRLIFRTYLLTRLKLGINTTGSYVLEHLADYDTEKIVTSVNEDSITWRVDETKEKLMSVQTIAKYVLNFNREIENLL